MKLIDETKKTLLTSDWSVWFLTYEHFQLVLSFLDTM